VAVTTTAQALIRDALLLIGAIDQTQQPNGIEATDAFRRLNEMVDSWSTQRLTMRLVQRATAGLVNGQSTYTIGTGGDFNIPRPTIVDNCTLSLGNTTPATEIPLSPLTDAAYQGISQKTLESGQPNFWYFEATMPEASIFVWPVPTDEANTLVIYYPEPLAQFATLATSYVLPPGYARALRTNLAVMLAPEYGRVSTPMLLMQANESLGDLKRLNVPMMDLGMDPGLTADRRGGYNIYSDTGA
jgi:hypothetical protein